MQKLSDAPVSYLSIWFRIFLPLVAAIYMIVQGSHENGQFLEGYTFLFPLAYCYLCCSLVINLTHYFIAYMDQHIGWYLYYSKRLVYQLCFAFLMIGVNYLLVKFYFNLMDSCFSASSYMTAEFHTSIWMVFAMNLFYFGWFFASNFLYLENRKNTKKLNHADKNTTDYLDSLKVRVGKKNFSVDVVDIERINMSEKTLMIIYDDGKQSYMDETMTSIFKMLDPKVFYRINRSTIYPLAQIQNYMETPNHSHVVIPFKHSDKTVSNVISKTRITNFKKVFEDYCTDNR